MSNKGSKKQKGNVLNIGQSLTIDNISDVLLQYKESIDKNDSVILRSESIESIDLSGIQLIHAILKGAEQGINASIEFSYSEATKDIIEKCGFGQII